MGEALRKKSAKWGRRPGCGNRNRILQATFPSPPPDPGPIKHLPTPSHLEVFIARDQGRACLTPPPIRSAMASSDLTELEKAIEKVVDVFFQCASREGNKDTLSTSEFKELVTLQLPNLMKNVGNLEEKMKSLDVNNDQELKFGEYWRLIGELAKGIKREKVGKKK
ncbi:protein S100-A13-like [Notechis scutatus]|uniref:Protein S100-A13-like n=1 Tax=Notechis scutatus TaxID=8663 RepID=A0A6J1VTX3_9SAUR|nr:protein S100-A13-like [Notechis scutatus]XP_026546481.1 protein S100-A13-like [Notechis scutatus]XP_026546485.1 protein S100-A13-like [Notechis scutatus]XP_026546487.1 protein S100-A13-like [Notechis scutatus]